MTKHALLKMAVNAALMLALLSTDAAYTAQKQPRPQAVQGRALTKTPPAPVQKTTQQITPVVPAPAKQPASKKQNKKKSAKKKKAQHKKKATAQAQQKSAYRKIVNTQHSRRPFKRRLGARSRKKRVLRVGQRTIAKTVTPPSAPAQKSVNKKGNLRAVSTKYEGAKEVGKKKKMKNKQKMKNKNEKKKAALTQDGVKK